MGGGDTEIDEGSPKVKRKNKIENNNKKIKKNKEALGKGAL